MESESDKKGPTRALLCCQESGAIRRAEACLRRREAKRASRRVALREGRVKTRPYGNVSTIA